MLARQDVWKGGQLEKQRLGFIGEEHHGKLLLYLSRPQMFFEMLRDSLNGKDTLPDDYDWYQRREFRAFHGNGCVLAPLTKSSFKTPVQGFDSAIVSDILVTGSRTCHDFPWVVWIG
jgi:hypothetical protein